MILNERRNRKILLVINVQERYHYNNRFISNYIDNFLLLWQIVKFPYNINFQYCYTSCQFGKEFR